MLGHRFVFNNLLVFFQLLLILLLTLSSILLFFFDDVAPVYAPSRFLVGRLVFIHLYVEGFVKLAHFLFCSFEQLVVALDLFKDRIVELRQALVWVGCSVDHRLVEVLDRRIEGLFWLQFLFDFDFAVGIDLLLAEVELVDEV